MKVVFDTNVLVAAFLTEGLCSKLLGRARRRDFDLILCSVITNEFQQALTNKFSVSSEIIDAVLLVLSEAAKETRQDIHSIPRVCRDPDDDLVLACAQDAGADYLVTGDEDLLVLKAYKTITIISPRDFERLFSD